MPIKVNGPGGVSIDFPDGTDPGTINSVMTQHFGGGEKKEPPAEPRTWGGAAMEAVGNVPASAMKFGENLVQPLMHPLDTLGRIGELGAGAVQKAGQALGTEALGTEGIPQADAVGKFVKDRYGSAEALKNTLATDPVGLAADASMVLTGGGTAAARLPGVAGKLGEVTAAAGRAVDPLSVVSLARKAAPEAVGGLGTHTGGESISRAAAAGYEGGEAAKAFQENLRGTAPTAEVVTDARNAVGGLRRQRGKAYVDEMAKVGADTTVLDFTKIDKALADVSGVKTFKGQSLSPKTQGIRDEINEAVSQWRALDPKEYHTPEGLDALKQKIGDIRDSTQYGTPDRVVADKAYQAVRQTIVDQVPAYGKIMKGYEEASEQIREIERTLSINPNASIDTSLRKLQSVLRNNVNSTYGRRAELAEFLVNAGAPHLMEKLTGQALNSWTPRGLGKVVGSADIIAVLAGHPLAAAALPLMSPRFMGESAYYAGKGAKVADKLPLRGGAQTSRAAGALTSPLQPGGEP